MDSEKEFKILARKKWVVICGRENSKMGPNMSVSWDTAVFSIFSHMLMWVLGRDLADTAKALSQSVHFRWGDIFSGPKGGSTFGNAKSERPKGNAT